MPVEVGANSPGVTLAEIYRNIAVDQGFPIGTPSSLDGALHGLDLSLSAARRQSARDCFDAPWGTTFTVAACATTQSSGVITTANSTASIKRGMFVSGTGIPVGAQVLENPATAGFIISPVATATGSVTCTFYPPNVGETVPRFEITSSAIAKATSGTLVMSAIQLPVNATISNFNILFGTTGDAGPTNQWMALYDNQRNLLAISADGTSTAVTASTVVTYPVATLASGAGTSYVTPYSGLYYVGFLLATSNAPTFTGVVGSAIANALPPISCGTSTASLTAPSTFPTQAGTITGTTGRLYAYLT